MPTLRQLTCRVEKGSSNIPLREYNTVYGDGVVSTFVGIPSNPTTFSVHLTSEGFIANGLAMFVFIDGIAQCNRNRRDLQDIAPDVEPKDTEINFRVRQKETKCGDGQFVAHDWRFDKLNTAAADKITQSPDVKRHSVGTIEVVVLRCQASPPTSPHAAPKAHVPSKKSWKQVGIDISGNTTPKAVKPSTKAPVSDKASSVGGFGEMGGFGLFDGAEDARPATFARAMFLGLDGAGDRMPGGWDDPPPNEAWGSTGAANTWEHEKSQNKDSQDDKGWGEPSHVKATKKANSTASVKAKSKSGALGLVRDYPRFDGSDGSPNSSPNGIVINQYVSRSSEVSRSGQRHTRQQHRSVSAPQLQYPSPWQNIMPPFPQPFPFPQPHPFQHMYSPQVQSEFAQFLAWKNGAGQANAPFPPAGFSNAAFPPLFEEVGEGTYAAGQAQKPSSKQPKPKSESHSKHSKNDSWGSSNTKSSNNNNNNNQDSWNEPNDDGANKDQSNDNWNQQANDSNNNNNSGSWNTPAAQDKDVKQDSNDQPQGWDPAQPADNSGDGEQANTSWNTTAPADNSGSNDNWATTANNAPPPQASNAPKHRTQRTPGSKSSHSSSSKSAHDFDPLKPYTRSYWSNWKAELHLSPTVSTPPSSAPSRNAAKEASSSRARIYPSPPTSPISPSVVAAAKLSHQVQPSKGAVYHHSVSRPRYVDSMEKPYAVFVFKYRSNEMLMSIFDNDPKECAYNRGSYRDRMLKAKKEDMVAELMRMKAALGFDSDDSVDSDLEAKDDSGSALSAAKSVKSQKSKASAPKKATPSKAVKDQAWGNEGNASAGKSGKDQNWGSDPPADKSGDGAWGDAGKKGGGAAW